jgi:hypothetical protein
MISELEKYLYSKLDAMQTEKAERLKNVEPHMITKSEFFSAVDKDIRAIMNKLFHEKRIKVHKTIHADIHDYIELVKED